MSASVSASIPQGKSEKPFLKFLQLIPGILLLAVIGYAGKFLEKFLNTYAKTHHWTFPNIEYVLWAIVIGLLISNLLTVPKIFLPGIATYEFWLKLGIVLLGSRFVLADILKLGGISLALVVGSCLQSDSETDQPAGRGIIHLRCLRHHRRQGCD